ncbi:cytochrome P450 [Dactylosporangium siamense]|uniref:Cytochrome P450 n=1 Tax=Dactylosporangium siamense TaxID=685454 RepID=A0A919PKU8_9ACTN|nr:cytochrome P450 [Dactylosporangium siamense]GIG45392.1 cytochrome P450 [Dactylosporangium siamense]
MMHREPIWRAVPALARDPLAALERLGAANDGAIVRLDVGPVRPLLLTSADHVQLVLRERSSQYVRDGMLWKPLRRLEGDGIASDGPSWQRSRNLLQPIFTARAVRGVLDAMADAIVAAVAELEADGRAGRPVELVEGMTRVVFRALIRAFFADRIPSGEAGVLGAAISTAFGALGWRIALPFAPDWLPVPGDQRFRRAVRQIDDIVYPHVQRVRGDGGGDGDILSLLVAARDENGAALTDRQVRDDVVSMFVAGTEATALTLSWLWMALDAHPDVAARVVEEVDAVVGDAAPAPEHLDRLVYTRQVLQETMRLWPAGWIVPRTAAEPDVIDGVPIRAGATVLVSPYVMHRLPTAWPDPHRFDPDRFGPAAPRRHRYAFLPFGGGPHQCLGNHLFTAEAQLVVAAVLSRHRPELVGSGPLVARATAALRPRQPGRFVLHRR